MNAMILALSGWMILNLAYIGPGVSGGVIAVILGVLMSLGLAVLAVVWYPLKRLTKKLRSSGDSAAVTGEAA